MRAASLYAAAVAVTTAVTSAEAQTKNRAGVAASPARPEWISCDTFMKRLRDAWQGALT
jgi:hypothetical protein